METGLDARGEAPPSDNLYVSELPPETTEESLRKMFGPGVTQCKVLPSRIPGSTRVALVRFSSVKEATNVREILNGAIPPDHSKPVRIRFCGKLDGKGGCASKGSMSGMHRSEPYSMISGAYSNEEAQLMNLAAFGNSHTAERKDVSPSDNLYITGLPLGLDNDTLKATFSQYGVVVQCKVLDPRPDATSSHALVRFSTVEEAVAVKQALSGYIMTGLSEPLLINYAIQKDKGFAKGDKGTKGGKGFEQGGDGLFWDELAPPMQWEAPPMQWEAPPVQWEGNGWKGDSWKGVSWKGDGEPGWKGGLSLPARTGEKGAQSWMDGDAPAQRVGFGKKDGGKGPEGSGKGGFFSMEKVLQGFAEAQCLPGHQMTNDDNALHISGLPKDCDDIHLYKLMAPFGAIPQNGIKAMKHPDGTCKGVGFVNYIEPSAMEAAMQMLNGTLLPDGTVMNVTLKHSRNQAGQNRRSDAYSQPAVHSQMALALGASRPEH